MKIRDFLPVLILAVAIMALPAFAQEDVIPAEDEIIIEEEPVEEEVVPEEEYMMEEEQEEEVVEEPEEEIVEEPTSFTPGWTGKAYVNFGPIEPWGDPGTGMEFNMGMRIQGGAQLNIAKWFNLPAVLQPLTAEVMLGYGTWKPKSETGKYVDASTSVISVLALGRYDVTDLILNLIGFEYPALGIFGVAGLQYNMQSWDFPNWGREFDTASSFGLNLGLGVKYNLQSLVGKPVEIDLRFTQGVFIMGDVKDSDGVPYYDETYFPSWDKDNRDYHHTENGLLLGIGYPF